MPSCPTVAGHDGMCCCMTWSVLVMDLQRLSSWNVVIDVTVIFVFQPNDFRVSAQQFSSSRALPLTTGMQCMCERYLHCVLHACESCHTMCYTKDHVLYQGCLASVAAAGLWCCIFTALCQPNFVLGDPVLCMLGHPDPTATSLCHT